MCCPVRTYPGDLEGSHGVGGEFHHVHDGDMHEAIGLRAAVGPVLVTLDPGALLQLRHHHNSHAALLPNHPPEVRERLWQRTLES